MGRKNVLKYLRRSTGLLPVAAMTVFPASAQAQDARWDEEEEDTRTYGVVINHEEQYSIWPEERELPLGWNDVGKACKLDECHDYIKEVWTDMRPLSLRKKLADNPRADELTYKVVINHEEQYAVWTVEQKATDDWRDTGKTCKLDECHDYIEEVWTDMRPLSLRKR